MDKAKVDNKTFEILETATKEASVKDDDLGKWYEVVKSPYAELVEKNGNLSAIYLDNWNVVVDSEVKFKYFFNEGHENGLPVEFDAKYDRGNVVYEIVDPQPLLKVKLQELAEFRWKVETAGLDFYGNMIDTSRESQMLIMGARLAAMSDESFVFDWKSSDGWMQIDAQTIIAISDAVRAHIQDCFTREKEIHQKLSEIKDAFELMEFNIESQWSNPK